MKLDPVAKKSQRRTFKRVFLKKSPVLVCAIHGPFQSSNIHTQNLLNVHIATFNLVKICTSQY